MRRKPWLVRWSHVDSLIRARAWDSTQYNSVAHGAKCRAGLWVGCRCRLVLAHYRRARPLPSCKRYGSESSANDARHTVRAILERRFCGDWGGRGGWVVISSRFSVRLVVRIFPLA